MPVVSTKKIVDHAFRERYGVPAINIVNDLTLEAVLSGAVDARSPLIVQTSVKTVRTAGSRVLIALWQAMTAGIEVPVALHLDHCPDRAVITECLELGWNSVLFDASHLSVSENQRQTAEVVAEARRHGAHVEGEIESITGVEDGVGADHPGPRESLATAAEFVQTTGVDLFAPAIGNAHGLYRARPELDGARVTELVEACSVPIALHGGSGLSTPQFRDLIRRGCAKINISTALKIEFMRANLDFLDAAQRADQWDPPALFASVRDRVAALTAGLAETFGSAKAAW